MEFVYADKPVCRNGEAVLGVVGVALGDEGDAAGFVGLYPHYAVGNGRGAVACGVVEADDVARLYLRRVYGLADDERAGIEGTLHGVRKHYHREYPADGGHLILIDELL